MNKTKKKSFTSSTFYNYINVFTLYFFVCICIYMATDIIAVNAGKPSRIVRPSALDMPEVGDIPKRYRGGETASDRARRKTTRIKRERYTQKQA